MFYKLNNYALNKLSFNLFLLGIQKSLNLTISLIWTFCFLAVAKEIAVNFKEKIFNVGELV